jgi:hypothetical protein
MKRRMFLPLASASLLCLVLTACTSFAPVYGDRSTTGISAARFNFAPPNNRLEQVILNRLKLAFPGEAGPGDPLLDIAAGTSSLPRSMSDTFDVSRPANFRLTATVTITQAEKTLFTASRFNDSAYQGGRLTPVDIETANGARESAARSVAESLRAAILAGYVPPAGP